MGSGEPPLEQIAGEGGALLREQLLHIAARDTVQPATLSTDRSRRA